MWKLSNIAIGDYVEVQVINKHDDRNLDGIILRGVVVKLNYDYSFAELDSGWCVHTKDNLLCHRACKASEAS